MKYYEAILLSYSEDSHYPDPSMRGFKTYDEAAQYILDNGLCNSCKPDGLSSQCAAEWMIEEYEEEQ